MKKKGTRPVKIGNIWIGGENPVAIQSMTNTVTADVRATVKQIHSLENAGCEIVRVAVKTMEDARAIRELKKVTGLPVVADIHFDHRLAIAAIKSGASKIRINPGNMGDLEHVDAVIDAAGRARIPIRIGVNSGSVSSKPVPFEKLPGTMVREAIKYVEHFEKKKFRDIIISLKASDVLSTVNAYRKISKECDYPLHLGITAAGLSRDAIVRSSVGIGALLVDGIGDTMRVSLTDDPVEEVYAAKKILAAIGSRKFGPEIISCPTCGRCQVDMISIAETLHDKLSKLCSRNELVRNRNIVIAVMGCEVNGPGEAKNADIGIAFGKNRGALFVKGKIVKIVKEKDAVGELLKMIIRERPEDGKK